MFHLPLSPFLQCRVRDLTLLNLSLSSKDISSASLPILRWNVTVSFLTADTFLPFTMTTPNPFLNTRSLKLNLPHTKDSVKKRRMRAIRGKDSKDLHPFVDLIQKEQPRVEEERARPANQEKIQLKERANYLALSKLASIHSVIIESMPNLKYLEVEDGVDFQFVKSDFSELRGATFSRPLFGLLSLKVLKTGEHLKAKNVLGGLSATNCVWLMVFLPSLTHLQCIVDFYSADERFLLNHEEALVGRSKITHLDVAFSIIKDEKRGWPGPMKVEVEVLEQFLSLTKGLVELKLHNRVPPIHKGFMVSSLVFLKCLKSSFKSLKYLSLIGEFTENLMGSASDDWKYKTLIPLRFDSLKAISFDRLSVSEISRFDITSAFKVKLQIPSLSSLQLLSESKPDETAHGYPENKVVDWIDSEFFPSTIKTIFLDEYPVGADGRLFVLRVEVEEEWRKSRNELVELCGKKGLKVKILRYGEQCEFDV